MAVPKTNPEDTLRRALKWCRREYNRKRDPFRHASHVASDVLEAAEQKFPDLRTCGVEGFCDDVGNRGVSYLNTGDSYGRTILAVTSRSTCRFEIGAWADFADSINGEK